MGKNMHRLARKGTRVYEKRQVVLCFHTKPICEQVLEKVVIVSEISQSRAGLQFEWFMGHTMGRKKPSSSRQMKDTRRVVLCGMKVQCSNRGSTSS